MTWTEMAQQYDVVNAGLIELTRRDGWLGWCSGLCQIARAESEPQAPVPLSKSSVSAALIGRLRLQLSEGRPAPAECICDCGGALSPRPSTREPALFLLGHNARGVGPVHAASIRGWVA
jgi:hypothetical protein